eukprot:s1063_g10.t1
MKTLFLELFCVSRTGVAGPNIAQRKRSSFYIIEEGETEDGEQGFWVVDEETGEEGFTGLYADTEFWVLGYDVDYYGEDTSWYSWAYFASDMDLPETETSASASTMDGQTDQNDQICFQLCCLFRLIGHGLLSFMINMLMSVTLLYRLCIGLYRTTLKSIHASDPSDAISTDYTGSEYQHPIKFHFDCTEEHAFLNYDHGAQQSLLCEYVNLGTHPTYLILDSGCARAMGSRYAIDRLVQACQAHFYRDNMVQ